VSDAYPCGTCGGPTSDGACTIRIKSGKADSDCPSLYAFLVSAAAKFTKTRPCTNVAINCPLHCDEIHWKYNFIKHLDGRHPSWKQLLPPSFIPQIQITAEEQIALGIPESKVHQLPPPLAAILVQTPSS
ncbi:hypothetical protein B0H13DRAFT_1566743, partial [Mycena leptocephala]